MINKYPKLFSRATIKLTLIYTMIIFSISVAFSLVIGFVAIERTNKNFYETPTQIILPNGKRVDFDPIFESYHQRIEEDIITTLILVNIIILIVSAGVSFALSRFTLKPIEKVMNEQTDFIANASHELKTPLAVMQIENEVILREKSATKLDFREKLQSNLSEIQKLRKLTDYLLTMNAIDSQETEFFECDLDEIIKSARQRISTRSDAKNIKIIQKITPAKIYTNRDNLTEIVFILLDNAVKYSPNNSRIHLNANSNEISVTDQGSGIPDADISRIFERFYRSEKSHTSEGFGLGLSLAKTLAEKNNVKISAENIYKAGKSHEKSGAKFTIKL